MNDERALSGPHATFTTASLPNANVFPLRPRKDSVAEQRAIVTVILLAFQAKTALEDVINGDVDALFTAHLATIKAVSVAMSAGLSSSDSEARA